MLKKLQKENSKPYPKGDESAMNEFWFKEMDISSNFLDRIADLLREIYIYLQYNHGNSQDSFDEEYDNIFKSFWNVDKEEVALQEVHDDEQEGATLAPALKIPNTADEGVQRIIAYQQRILNIINTI